MVQQTTMEQDAWYYSIDGSQQGPMNAHQLRQELQGGRLSGDTPVWRAGMADWVAASQIPEFRIAGPSSSQPPAFVPQLARAHTGVQVLSNKQKNRRIFFIVASSLAAISICLPWAYIIVPQGGFNAAGGMVLGVHFWQAVVAMILGLIALAAAIVDLAVVHGAVVWQVTKWCHLGLYIALTIFSLLGVVLPIAQSSGNYGFSVYVIPLASVVLLGVSIAAMVMAIFECRTGEMGSQRVA